MSNTNDAKKVIELKEYLWLKDKSSDFDEKIIRMIHNEMRKELDRKNFGSSSEMENRKLKEECMALRRKLKKAIPYHAIIYLVVSTLFFGVALTLSILYYRYKVYLIEPYYLVCTCIISLTLFLTALDSLKDWKVYLNGEKRDKGRKG